MATSTQPVRVLRLHLHPPHTASNEIEQTGVTGRRVSQESEVRAVVEHDELTDQVGESALEDPTENAFGLPWR